MKLIGILGGIGIVALVGFTFRGIVIDYVARMNHIDHRSCYAVEGYSEQQCTEMGR